MPSNPGSRRLFSLSRFAALCLLVLLLTVLVASSFGTRLVQSAQLSGFFSGTHALMTSAPPGPAPQAAVPETIATYAADCTTPKTSFVLGETVCAVTTGAPIESPAVRAIAWVNPESYVIQKTDLDTGPSDSFGLPATTTSLAFGVTVTNVGTWNVVLTLQGRGVGRAAASFTVSDPSNASVDLNVYNFVTNPESIVEAGSDVTVKTFVTNFGPDSATDVEFTEGVPANSTFVSATQDSGPTFNCVHPAPGGTGTSMCTLASMAKDAVAEFTFVYQVSASAPKGTLIASLAQVSSATTEVHTSANQWTARALVTGNPNAPACGLGCPANMTITANTMQGGNPGAIVDFASDIESSGDCGTISSAPASGTFFPVGTTLVSVSSQNGGGSCSFNITVIETAAPTISCAADQTETASGSELEVEVTVNTPTATGTNVVITGVRGDNRPLTDPYPVGTTTITWTATECNDPPLCEDPSARTATCTQQIIVVSADAPTITCPSDKTFTATSGCEVTVTETDLGSPTATGSNVTITSRRSDDLPLTAPFPGGQTTITWTATDDADRVVSCTQIITVNTTGSDNTPPTLNVPPDVTVATDTCSATLNDELGAATGDDDCGSVSIVRTGVPAGSIFPVGTTTVTYTATDNAGNSTSGQQQVTVTESVAPTISAPADANYSCASEVPAADPSQASANDNCGTPTVTVSEMSSGIGSAASPLVILRTFTATDASNNSANAVQTITVIDNAAPVITLDGPNPQYVECNTAYTEHGATANDNCSGSSAATPSGVVDVTTPGTYTITYNATDAVGNSATPVTRTVIVQDTTAPTITLNGNTITLWPPNHSYHTVSVSNFVTAVSDGCNTGLGVGDVVISKVTSDESENGNGDGNTLNDIVIAANCKSVQLRSERQGGGNGRVYTITFKVTDASGNVATATAQVKVPKNNNGSAIDSGPQYTVNGNCP